MMALRTSEACRHDERGSAPDGEGRNGVWLAEHGLDVVSLDFSEAAQKKAALLASERGVEITLVRGMFTRGIIPKLPSTSSSKYSRNSVHAPTEPKNGPVCARRSKPDGLLIIQGYTPKQLQYGTGGPKEIEHLYTRRMLEEAFYGLRDVTITEEELDMHEGTGHGGMSAVINFTGRK